ncbi:MAG: hypothetical protein U0326_06840 [Polyangiales bacterium]
MTAKTLRASSLLLALSTAACGNTFDPAAIERPIGADGGVEDTPVAPLDNAPQPDAATPDIAPPPPDVAVIDTPATPDVAVIDTPATPDVVVIDTPPPPPDVPPPPPDVPPPDSGMMCRPCMAFSAVQFCPGTGSGACLAYAGCSAESCQVCAPAVRGGDACGSDVPVISRRGRSRSVFTTCGAADNVDTNCGRPGPDIVIAARTETSGRVSLTFTTPPGVDVFVGYDWLGNTTCRTQSLTRTCAGTSNSNERSVSATLLSGTYYAYISTSVPATIVVDAELP